MAVVCRHRVRIALCGLLLLVGTFYCATIDYGLPENGVVRTQAHSLEDATLSVLLGRGSLRLEAVTASAEHETGLRELLAEHFDLPETRAEFRPGFTIPPAWETMSSRLLYLVAALDSARATMSPDRIRIRGVTADDTAFRQRLALLQSVVPDAMAVDSDVLIVTANSSFAALCERNFAILAGESINFLQSSTEIRKSSYPLLDRVIEFAYTCQDRKIAISGHTDATGSDSWNLHLSTARAQAVADYLVRGGIPAERLIVAGLGSTAPIADNETVHGRLQNRRIDLELR